MRDVNARLPSKNSPVGPGLCSFCRLSICVPRAKGEKKRERGKKFGSLQRLEKKVNVNVRILFNGGAEWCRTLSCFFCVGASVHSGCTVRERRALGQWERKAARGAQGGLGRLTPLPNRHPRPPLPLSPAELPPLQALFAFSAPGPPLAQAGLCIGGLDYIK